jgi:hypothetical protein
MRHPGAGQVERKTGGTLGYSDAAQLSDLHHELELPLAAA